MSRILMSIKPYYGFLIVAKLKGWDLSKYGLHEKTIEARKDCPLSPNWDRRVVLYFSKDKKSLSLIPEEYRAQVADLCGKAVCEFVCAYVYQTVTFDHQANMYLWGHDWIRKELCLSENEMISYGAKKPLFGLRIFELRIFDSPKNLYEFNSPCKMPRFVECSECPYEDWNSVQNTCFARKLTRAPQSWQYID